MANKIGNGFDHTFYITTGIEFMASLINYNENYCSSTYIYEGRLVDRAYRKIGFTAPMLLDESDIVSAHKGESIL